MVLHLLSHYACACFTGNQITSSHIRHSIVTSLLCVFFALMPESVYTRGRACTFACLPCPCDAVCSMYRKPRTVWPMMGVHKLLWRNWSWAAPASRDRVSWGCDQLQRDVWLDNWSDDSAVVSMCNLDLKLRTCIYMYKLYTKWWFDGGIIDLANYQIWYEAFFWESESFFYPIADEKIFYVVSVSPRLFCSSFPLSR